MLKQVVHIVTTGLWRVKKLKNIAESQQKGCIVIDNNNNNNNDRVCGLVVRVLGYRSGGPGPIPGTTRIKVVGLERGPLSLVSTTEELLGRKVAAPI
jgi:hypothetical protein